MHQLDTVRAAANDLVRMLETSRRRNAGHLDQAVGKDASKPNAMKREHKQPPLSKSCRRSETP